MYQITTIEIISLFTGPFNLSGEWSGVMGDVVNGKHEIALSMWLWNEKRHDIVDLITFTWDYRLSFLVVKQPTFDPGLFLRPFTDLSWFLIIVSFFIHFILLFLIHKLEDYDLKNSVIVIELVAWFLFILLYAYYGGALTMYFSVEPVLPFETTEDVLLAMPDWKLLVMKDMLFAFKDRALQVNIVFISDNLILSSI